MGKRPIKNTLRKNCSFFNSPAGCKKGNDCDFFHPDPTTNRSTMKQIIQPSNLNEKKNYRKPKLTKKPKNNIEKTKKLSKKDLDISSNVNNNPTLHTDTKLKTRKNESKSLPRKSNNQSKNKNKSTRKKKN